MLLISYLPEILASGVTQTVCIPVCLSQDKSQKVVAMGHTCLTPRPKHDLHNYFVSMQRKSRGTSDNLPTSDPTFF